MKWNGRKFFLSLRTKLIILFMLLIIIPFVGSGIGIYNKYTADVENNARASTQQLVSQININLDNYLKDIDKLTLVPFYDNAILDILKTHRDKTKKTHYIPNFESMKLSLFISSLTYDRPEIKGIFIFANDGTMFNNLDLQSNAENEDSAPWLDILTQNNLRIFMVSPHYTGYYQNETEEVFSVIRAIKEPLSEKTLGIIKIDLTSKVFERILDASKVSANSKIYITDLSGNIYYPVNQQKNTFSLPSKGSAIIEGVRYLTAFETSYITDLNVIGIMDSNDMKKNALGLVRFTLMISLVSLFLAIVIAVLVSSKITGPVRHLQKKMKKIQKGNFKERATVFSRDEIGDLSQGFNVMMDEITRLVKEVYETGLREREAELSALQSQINPHFLYNTFELVNMIALKSRQFEISDIISSLGRLLRYTVDKKEKPVMLREEIRFVKAYLRIISSRYGEKLKTKIVLDPYLETCLVPKLILQPLVENAVQHGICENEGEITIQARREENLLMISVTDNGKGIDDVTLAVLEKKIYGQDDHIQDLETFGTEKKGYALRNVHHRIRLLYGENYGLYVESSVGKGSRFILKLPTVFSDSRELN